MRRHEDLNDSPLRAFKTREALRGVARDHDRSAAVEVASAAIATPGKATLTSGLGASGDVLVQLQRTMASAAVDAANLEHANRTGDFKRASWAMAGLKRFITQVPQLLAMVPRGASGDVEGKIEALVQRARTALDAAPQTSEAARRAADRGDFAPWRAEVDAWRAKAGVAKEAEPVADRQRRRDLVSLLAGSDRQSPVVGAKAAGDVEARSPESQRAAMQSVDEPAIAARPMFHGESSSTSKPSTAAEPRRDADDMHDVAAQGVADGGGSMPHADVIARSFGPEFDISDLQAHIGGAAARASKRLGAQAYATGNHIAFARAPDLHTAAHEATHAVLQLRGVAPAGGIGSGHDMFERHADAVADAVVAGRTAAPLLARMTGGARATGAHTIARRAAAVQLKEANSVSTGGSGKSSAGDGMWSELAPGERTVEMQLISRVDAFVGVHLRSHPAGPKDGARLPFGTLVSVSRKTEKGWYYVTVLPEDVVTSGEPSAAPPGATGFIENYHVASAMPEPKARLEKVESGALLKDIAARHYKHHFAWGNDARVYVQAIYHANKNRDAVIRQGANMEVNREALSTTSLSRALELWGQARAVSGQALWMPSEAFVQQLKAAGTVHQASISAAAWESTVSAAEAGWEALQYVAGFSVGLLQGAWSSLEDLLKGLPDLIKTAWTVIKDLFNDFAAIRAFATQISEAWKNRDAILMRVANDFIAKWEDRNPLHRGNFQGEFLGYVMATVFIAGLTMGAGAMVAGAGRFGAFVRLIQFADEMGSIGTYISKVKSKVRLPKGLAEELRGALKPAARAHGGGPHGHGAEGELRHIGDGAVGESAQATGAPGHDATHSATAPRVGKSMETGVLLGNATQPFKGGSLTQAGRALTKHPEVLGYTKDTLRTVLRTDSQINAAAAEVLKNILQGTCSSLKVPRYGAVLEFRASSGFGARFLDNTGNFIGFINP